MLNRLFFRASQLKKELEIYEKDCNKAYFCVEIIEASLNSISTILADLEVIKVKILAGLTILGAVEVEIIVVNMFYFVIFPARLLVEIFKLSLSYSIIINQAIPCFCLKKRALVCKVQA